jgi:hypothetical protein
MTATTTVCQTERPSTQFAITDPEIIQMMLLTDSRRAESAPVAPAEIDIAPLPEISDPAFEPMLAHYLELCSERRDSDRKHLATKIRILSDMVKYFNGSLQVSRLNPKFQRGIFLMLTTNILRYDYHVGSAQETGDFLIPQIDPSWSYLSHCYHLLLRFIQLYPNAEFINFHVMLRFMELTAVPDSRERQLIASCLTFYYDARDSERAAMAIAIRDHLILVRETRMSPLAAAPLISCARHAIGLGGSVDSRALGIMLLQGVVPLVSSAYYGVIHMDVKITVIEAVSALPELAMPVLSTIQRLWPITGLSKGKLVIDLLFSVVLILDRKVFVSFSESFFQFVANCIKSTNLMLSSAVLDWLLREELRHFLKENGTTVIDKLADAAVEVTERHWYVDSRTKASSFLDVLLTINRAEIIRRKKMPRKDKVSTDRELDRKHRRWRKIFQTIDWQSQTVTEQQKTKELEQALYAVGEEPTFPMTHFLPIISLGKKG